MWTPKVPRVKAEANMQTQGQSPGRYSFGVDWSISAGTDTCKPRHWEYSGSRSCGSTGWPITIISSNRVISNSFVTCWSPTGLYDCTSPSLFLSWSLHLCSSDSLHTKLSARMMVCFPERYLTSYPESTVRECTCGEAIQNVDHVLLDCMLIRQQCDITREKLGENLGLAMLDTQERIQEFMKWWKEWQESSVQFGIGEGRQRYWIGVGVGNLEM